MNNSPMVLGPLAFWIMDSWLPAARFARWTAEAAVPTSAIFSDNVGSGFGMVTVWLIGGRLGRRFLWGQELFGVQEGAA